MKVSQVTRRMNKQDFIVIKNTNGKILISDTVNQLKKDNPLNKAFVERLTTSAVGNIIIIVAQKEE